MPANPRQNSKRELSRAEGNLDKALLHIAPLAEQYRPLHPEISEALEVIAAVLIEAQHGLQQVRADI